MAMIPIGRHNGSGSRIGSTLAEINVTPLVDVMLVLLIIFMITSSMENLQSDQDQELLREEQLRRLEELEMKDQAADQQVSIDLPKVNSEPVDLAAEKKLVLTLSDELEFFIGKTSIVRCQEIAPDLKGYLTDARKAGAGAKVEIPSGFKTCMQVVEEKLLENEKLQEDQELYLRADRALDYGLVLTVMARVRKAGITKFGLVAEPDLKG